jgi:hypothetical protein
MNCLKEYAAKFLDAFSQPGKSVLQDPTYFHIRNNQVNVDWQPTDSAPTGGNSPSPPIQDAADGVASRLETLDRTLTDIRASVKNLQSTGQPRDTSSDIGTFLVGLACGLLAAGGLAFVFSGSSAGQSRLGRHLNFNGSGKASQTMDRSRMPPEKDPTTGASNRMLAQVLDLCRTFDRRLAQMDGRFEIMQTIVPPSSGRPPVGDHPAESLRGSYRTGMSASPDPQRSEPGHPLQNPETQYPLQDPLEAYQELLAANWDAARVSRFMTDFGVQAVKQITPGGEFRLDPTRDGDDTLMWVLHCDRTDNPIPVVLSPNAYKIRWATNPQGLRDNIRGFFELVATNRYSVVLRQAALVRREGNRFSLVLKGIVEM